MKFRDEIGESLTLKFAQAASERRKNGQRIISLGLGEPDFDVPNEIIKATISVLQRSKSGYSDSMGILSLREKIAQKLCYENSINCNAENIIVTAGAKQAFQLVSMALLEPGDEVIIINPSFVSFIPQVLISEPQAKIRTVDISKYDFSIDLENILKEVGSRTKLMILNTPNNPAGYIIERSILAQLYQIAEENDFFIISDEIYEKLIFSEIKHFSIGSLEVAPKRVITINGFSKSHAMTGWRLGYACFPDLLRDKLLKLQQHMNTNTCTFIQQAVAEAFDIDNGYLLDYNKKLKTRLKKVQDTIASIKNLRLVAPKAGFFAFIDIHLTGLDSNSFCSRLIQETGVATTPGIAFGKNWDDHVRISFATNDAILDEGLELLSCFIKGL